MGLFVVFMTAAYTMIKSALRWHDPESGKTLPPYAGSEPPRRPVMQHRGARVITIDEGRRLRHQRARATARRL